MLCALPAWVGEKKRKGGEGWWVDGRLARPGKQWTKMDEER